MKILRLILGDQLNSNHSWFDNVDDDIIYCMFEMKQETSYVNHHIQKIIAFFSAMRNFAGDLENAGHQIEYFRISESKNKHSLEDNIRLLAEKYSVDRFEYLLPDEYRLDKQLKELCQDLQIESSSTDTEHFLCERSYVEKFFEGKKSFIMENFYRDMRKKYDILMEGSEPYGSKWNYDHSNRESLNKDQKISEFEVHVTDQRKILDEINEAGIKYIGQPNAEKFIWPVSREQALKNLKIFLDKGLQYFGQYQDAMHSDYKFLYHSRISFALNAKMLSPLEVVREAVEHWESNANIDIAQIEGFVRQIIGWREYMRGIYWAFMPEYAEKNYFGHDRKLPEWYWTGNTKMNCLKHAINQSLETSYAHHIQRLMITGNFALLAGVDPDEIDKWYLGIYIDAIEWVEITNTRGMSQFADGGIVGTKPYISSASYINKMSDYCKECHYKHTIKTGEGACPFNSMYWRFYEVNRDKLDKNPRVALMYRVWDRMDSKTQASYLEQADEYLSCMNDL